MFTFTRHVHQCMSAATRLAAAAVGAVLVAGCGGNRDVSGDFIPPERSAQALHRAMLAQAATGAAADRMLSPVHFDGPALNSLGEQKLALMLHASAFMLAPEVFVTSAQPPHLEAVRQHLQRLGFAPDDVAVTAGTNPSALFPAAPRLEQQQAMQASADEAPEPAR